VNDGAVIMPHGEEQLATAAGCAPRDVEEALSPLLSCAVHITQLPLMVAGPGGEVFQSGPDLRSECAVTSVGIQLERHPAGEWGCPVTACAHHRSFRYRQLERSSLPVALVHCEGDKKIDAFAELATSALSSFHERSSTLEELARVTEEIDWLNSLGDILKRVSSERSTFEEIFKQIGALLPVGAAEVWAPEPDAALYRCLVHHDEKGLSKNLESIGRTEDTDDLLQEMELCVIREESPSAQPLDDLLFRFARKLQLPAVAMPLEAKGQFQGILLISLADDSLLSAYQIKLLDALGRQVGLCVHLHALIEELRANEGARRELEIARDIQHSLLPQETPAHPTYDLCGGCVTAAQVGGDYYDFFERDGTLGLLIADVSGHSVGSGLIAMSFRSSFRHVLGMEGEPEVDRVLARVNAALCPELKHSGHFLSAFVCRYFPESRRLSYANAGHNRPFVLRARTGEFDDLEEAGLLIGILDGSAYQAGTTHLDEGDILLLYTDGIVEAENQRGELFGMERLKKAVRDNASRSAKEMYHYLLREMYLFQDERVNKDDVTLVILKAR
jgi:serine phosphatase RsbU (regulator of sigma subunit)